MRRDHACKWILISYPYRRTDARRCLNSNWTETEGKRHMALTPAGSKLDSILDSMDVDSLWQSGEYVYWQTG